ncbi:MAG: M23 family metallopeptidase [Bacteroidales bacterium]|jgi:hypothetical protein|nr:M23 family metallopeptidase [Bacteroidales bacterium]
MIKKYIILAAFLAATLNISSQEAQKGLFISPMRDTPSLSASFAELRNDHFHSGLDYKTGGVIGKEVLCAAEGYVYRIAVSSSGFGKAVYVRHPSGHSTVYAHLDSFRPDIEEYVKVRQYELKSFSVSLYPVRNQFRVSQGEVIGRSGNSGSSSGPHLHFEIRESASEDPLNPLIFPIGIIDRMKPGIEKIIIYPLNSRSTVNKSNNALTIKTLSTNGSYVVPNSEPPVIYGDIGIGIKCWDTFDNSTNRCGVYSIEMVADSDTVYSFTADRFSFTESRYLNSHIDYRAKVIDNEYIHKTYLQPGNRLSMYDRHPGRGILSFRDERDHKVVIIVSDLAGNRSIVSFRLRSVIEPQAEQASIKYSKVIPYGKSSDFTADGIRVHFPPLALYDTLFLAYNVRNHSRFLSPVHSVHDATVALHEPVRLSLRPDSIITGKEEKLCLVQIDRKGKVSFAGGEYKYGFVSADIRSLGDYAVSLDTVPPVIRSSFVTGADLTHRTSISFTVNDDFSGISNYEAYIDGEWALMEYDAKNNILIYRPEAPRIKENTIHRLELSVTDNRGNRTTLQSEFRW